MRPSALRRSIARVAVHHHHDAGLRGEPDQRDDADPHRGRQVVVEQRQQPDAADQRERHREQHDQRLGQVAEVAGRAAAARSASVSGTEDLHARLHLLEQLVLARST